MTFVEPNKRGLYNKGKVFKWTKQDGLMFLPWCGYPNLNQSVPERDVYRNTSLPINSGCLKKCKPTITIRKNPTESQLKMHASKTKE